MLSTFIIPLQVIHFFLFHFCIKPPPCKTFCEQADAASSSRIHTSININTETGRLSARRPNLQNQPALEKDVFKVFLYEGMFQEYV